MSALMAAIYVRVSTGGQEDNYSPKTQEDACRAYCLKQGYEVVDEHVYNEVFSGATLDARPEMRRLRTAVKQGEVKVVVGYSLDRLSRDQNHIGILLDEWKRRAVRIEFATEKFEDSSVGRFLIGAQAFAAELEREKIRERTGRGRRERVESGLPMPGAKAPFGYRWRPDEALPGRKKASKTGLEEDPATSWVVRRIFNESVTGKGQARIAEDLTADGIPTPTGRAGVWGQSTIRCIQRNQFYIGRAAAFRVRVYTECDSDDQDSLMRRVIKSQPESEWVALPEGVVPALIDAETFSTVQARFRLNRERAERSTKEPERVLLRGGYVKCGYCGHNMFVHRNGTRLTYRCIRRQRFKDCQGATHVIDPLDQAAWAKVESLLLNPEVIVAELERLEQQDPTNADLETIDKSLAQVQSRRKNLLGQLGLLDAESAAEVRDMLAEASQRIKALEAEREAVLSKRLARQQARGRLAELESWCETVAANLKDMTYEKQRLALDALGVRVTVWRKDDRAPKVEANIPLGVTKGSTPGNTSLLSGL